MGRGVNQVRGRIHQVDMDRTLARSNSRVTTSGLLGQVASASASVGEVTRRVIDLDRGDLANSGKVGRGSQTSGQRGEVPAITCGRNIGEYRIANLKSGDGSHNVCKAHLFILRSRLHFGGYYHNTSMAPGAGLEPAFLGSGPSVLPY